MGYWLSLSSVLNPELFTCPFDRVVEADAELWGSAE